MWQLVAIVDPEPPDLEASDGYGLPVDGNLEMEVADESLPMPWSVSDNAGEEEKLTDSGTLSWGWESGVKEAH